jgi:hypothetical protein
MTGALCWDCIAWRLRRAALPLALVLAAVLVTGCQNAALLDAISSRKPAAAASPTPALTKSEAEWRHEAEVLAPRYRATPNDSAMALAYANALRSGMRMVSMPAS